MRNKSAPVLALMAVLIGLAGSFATGCVDLDVGTRLRSDTDSMPNPGLDEPNPGNPGNSIVPLGPSGH
ncbi:hypothetical protein [Candidatus Palauibacter sp.]|uniref:hypothetical protein n=1 Tax=Candidatus Palauibacter sp. TaxID=3101350 RepID=UPI003B023171